MKNLRGGIFILFGLVPILSFSQSMRDIKQVIDYEPHTIIDYGIEVDVNTRVPFRGDISAFATAGRLSGNAVFEVTYINFNPEQQAAFQHAVDIWSTLIKSEVPIRIRAQMSLLDPGVLGSAGPTGRAANFDNAQKLNTAYVIAMAEKIAGHDLNDPTAHDINMEFSTAMPFYFGTDGNPPGDKFDFVTIILHEIGHGLGFIPDTFVTESGIGFHSIFGAPIIYSSHLETLAGINVVETFDSNTTELGNTLTSENLFFKSFSFPTTGERPKIYAPATYAGGSSISHLDSDTYPAGNPNSLMSPFANFGESIHDPGLALEMFEDMGWIAMDIDFLKAVDSEDSLTDRVLTLTVKGDNVVSADAVNLHYTYADFSSEVVVNMTPTGTADEYTAIIPATGFGEQVSYYINVDDQGGRTFTSPGEAPQFFWQFAMAKDTLAPIIIHEALSIVFLNNPILPIIATVTDNIGVGDLTISYKINDGVNTSIMVPLLNSSTDDGFYEGEYRLDWDVGALGLAQGDSIEYSLEIQDIAATPNSSVHPVKGIHKIRVEDLNNPELNYENDFNSPTSDFAGVGFTIGPETGFDSDAIHSDHPYRIIDGSGAQDSLTLLYLLKTPIILSDKGASMVFDEMVLVEPGTSGTVFGDDEFWDYVIVEGSNNFGVNWLPINDGYDSRAQPNWLVRYNSDIDNNGNSDAVGDKSLFINKEMDLTSNGKFTAGDTLLIRFRMYIDPFAHGWGWAIDNIKIQIDDLPPVITQVTPNYMFIGDTQITLNSKIEDKSGLDSVVYEVDFNGQVQLTSFPGTANLFTLDLGFPAITAGDVLKYRIIAVDKALTPNTSILPATGFFEVPVAVMGAPKSMYINDFNTPTDDFIGSNFNVTQPSGFVDPAIMSLSPYPDAPIDNAEMYYLLKYPIILNDNIAWVQYYEVALVQPSNDKVAFEVSKDGGITWIAVFNSYDASDQFAWFTGFNSFDEDGNSKGIGASSMLVPRLFNILDNPEISGGDEVLIRFRMTVNDNVHGWGWLIDNLEIQGPTTAIEDELNSTIQVYPNPTNTGSVALRGTLSGRSSQIVVTDVLGKIVLLQEVPIANNTLQTTLNLTNLKKGLYLISVSDNLGIYTSRIIVE